MSNGRVKKWAFAVDCMQLIGLLLQDYFLQPTALNALILSILLVNPAISHPLIPISLIAYFHQTKPFLFRKALLS